MTATQITRQRTRAAALPTTAPRRAAKPTTLHVLIGGMRPSSGPRLFAHTVAALRVLGMMSPSRPAVPVERLLAFLGHRAIDYHTNKVKTLEGDGTKCRLTVVGAEFFSARIAEGRAPSALVSAFESVFRTGAPSDEANVRPHHISTATV